MIAEFDHPDTVRSCGNGEMQPRWKSQQKAEKPEAKPDAKPETKPSAKPQPVAEALKTPEKKEDK